MNKQVNDGGAAFPTVSDSINFPQHGMSLRDWFAGQALQAIVSKAPYRSGKVDDDHNEIPIARGAYALADAMLAVRERK